RRTTGTVFKEFSNEGNLTDIFGVELLRHWYLVVLFLAWIWLMWRMYQQPKRQYKPKRKTTYFLSNTLALVVTVPLCIGGMRGGFTTAVRPITISNANQYVDSPQLAAIVLNTPFSLIRTFDKVAFEEVDFMQDEEAERLYSPLHKNDDKLPADTTHLHGKGKGKNVVLLIVESFGREYIGGYNKWLDDGKYRGYTPFLDSLMQHSLTFEYSYCNGRKSIDGMPSVISSIPMFVEPFFLTPMVMNDVSGLAKELKSEGYYSAFFHGAENGSMGFQAFARATGFNDYFGRTEFNRDKRFRGNEEFDGVWAVWDEPFLQYFALQMNDFRQPFVSTVFTASSHHPFAIPDEYKEIFPEEGIKIHKCVRYTDNA
ncbi:MAG: LTA synthase family protein, partial [Bacteroidaceae bacterium]|nr:LTA synthase family protein [Bacteroidaceae bacterium]